MPQPQTHELASSGASPAVPVDDEIGDIGDWSLEAIDADELDEICAAIDDDLGMLLCSFILCRPIRFDCSHICGRQQCQGRVKY